MGASVPRSEAPTPSDSLHVTLEDLELPRRRDRPPVAQVPLGPVVAGQSAVAAPAQQLRLTEELLPGAEAKGQHAFRDDGLVGTESQQLQLLAHYAELCDDFRRYQRTTREEGSSDSDGAQLLLLSGPPGTGKTKHAVSFARALGLPTFLIVMLEPPPLLSAGTRVPATRLQGSRQEAAPGSCSWKPVGARTPLWILSGGCLLGFAQRAVRGGATGSNALRGGVRSRVARAAGAVQEGDTIAVVGAGGNVGRLVAQRLCSMNMFQVHGVLRDKEKAKWAQGVSGLKLFEADSRDALALQEPLSNANAVVCTTGVPAFGIAGQWEKGNHPESVDHFGVKNAAHVWSSASGQKRRFVLMSSIGVTRRDGFPYSILNGGGVLDAKAKGEAAVRELAKERGFAVTVVRPGQLFGGPYENNRYLGTLFQLDKDSSVGAVKLEAGDTAVGDTLRSSLAGVLVRSLFSTQADMEFAVINEDGEPPSEDAIDAMLEKLSSGTPAAEADEQMQKRMGLAGETFGKAVENVVSGKLFDKS